MKTSLSHAIPNSIKTLRHQKGLSQEKLGQLSGLDRTYISGIERQTRNLTVKSLQKIIDALDVTTVYFLEVVKEELND